MKEIIAITDLSLLSVLGHDPKTQIQALRLSGLAQATRSFRLPAQPVTADFKTLLGKTGWRHFTRSGLMLSLAARALVAKNDSSESPEPGDEAGISVGYNDDASIHLFFSSFFSTLQEKSFNIINPTAFLNVSNNAPASHITIQHQFHGPVLTITTGFTAGLDALDAAATILRGGHASVMLAGGVQEINDELIESFALLPGEKDSGTLPSGEQGGVAVGEGCALLRLEKKSAPDLKTRAWIAGFGQGSCPRPAEPGDPAATFEAIQQALDEAQISAQEVGAVFLSAHGNSLADQAEARALKTIFNNQMPPATALKSLWGETYHAHGAMAAAAAVLCLEEGFLPATPRLVSGLAPESLGLSKEIQMIRARHALILALDRDQKAAAVILRFPQ